MPNHLKPLFVIGTGFHHYTTYDNPAFDCIYSCPKLLRDFAKGMVLRLRQFSAGRPKPQWRDLILDGVEVDIYYEQEETFPTK